jgi:hypothetical protein
VVIVIVAPWPDAALATPPTPAFVTSAVADAGWYATVVLSGWRLTGPPLIATAGAIAGPDIAGAIEELIPPPPPLEQAVEKAQYNAASAMTLEECGSRI